jgi:hypothetical protein
MKRLDFETQLKQYGLNLAAYRGACYYGACEEWSLSLAPYPADEIKQAKLAVRGSSAAERAVIVDTFLAAANVEKNSQIDAGLDGHDFRGAITIASFDDELVVNVVE